MKLLVSHGESIDEPEESSLLKSVNDMATGQQEGKESPRYFFSIHTVTSRRVVIIAAS